MKAQIRVMWEVICHKNNLIKYTIYFGNSGYLSKCLITLQWLSAHQTKNSHTQTHKSKQILGLSALVIPNGREGVYEFYIRIIHQVMTGFCNRRGNPYHIYRLKFIYHLLSNFPKHILSIRYIIGSLTPKRRR